MENRLIFLYHPVINVPSGMRVMGGRVFLSETQKDLARVHEIDPALLQGLWGQGTHDEVAGGALVLDQAVSGTPCELSMPALPAFVGRDNRRADYGTKDLRAGFTVECWLTLADFAPGQTVLDSRDATGHGLLLRITDRETLELVLNDGRTQNSWDCDPGMLVRGRRQHVGIVVDGGPKIISFVIDGALCDGGTARQFGWGRFSRDLRDCNGSGILQVGPCINGTLEHVRLYAIPLRTSQLIGNYRAGLSALP